MHVTRGDRIRDRLTGATGTVVGVARIPETTPRGGSWSGPLIHFDGATNATVWQWSTDALIVTD